MSTIADLLIKVRADTGPAEKDLNSFSGKVRNGFGKALLPAVGVLGAVAVGAKKTVDAASSLTEAQSAVGVVFGKSSKEMLNWSKSTDDALSQVQFLGAAKQFGTFGKTAGLAGRDLNSFSKDLIDAAGDMASFHDVPVAQALEDIRSGLAGETEPLRKYGILLNDAALRQEAMRQGLIKNTKEALTPQNKTLAAQALILAGLGPAAGDYARTSDSVANTARRQTANNEDLQASMGKGLLPVYSMFQGVLLRATAFMGEHTTIVQVGAGALAALATAVILTNGVLAVKSSLIGTKVIPAIIRYTGVQWLLNAALAANPIALIIIALIALGVAIVVAWRKSETFRNIVIGAWNAIKSATVGAFNAVKHAVGSAVDFIVNLVQKHPFVWLGRKAIEARDDVGKAISAIPGKIGAFIDNARNKAREVGNAIKNGVTNAADGVADALGKKLAPIEGVVNAVAGPIKAAFNGIKSVINGVTSAVRGLIDAIRSIPKPKLPNIDIPGFASGVRGFGGGLAVVGERGPELVALPRGSTVFSNAESRRMTDDPAGGSGGGTSINFAGDMVIREEVDADRAMSKIGRRLAVLSP